MVIWIFAIVLTHRYAYTFQTVRCVGFQNYDPILLTSQLVIFLIVREEKKS